MGLLETREPKSVTVGIRRRGRWGIIGDRRDERELEVQVKKDAVVDSGEAVKLELGNLVGASQQGRFRCRGGKAARGYQGSSGTPLHAAAGSKCGQ